MEVRILVTYIMYYSQQCESTYMCIQKLVDQCFMSILILRTFYNTSLHCLQSSIMLVFINSIINFAQHSAMATMAMPAIVLLCSLFASCHVA